MNLAPAWRLFSPLLSPPEYLTHVLVVWYIGGSDSLQPCLFKDESVHWDRRLADLPHFPSSVVITNNTSTTLRRRWTKGGRNMATNSLVAIWMFCGLAIVIMSIRLILGRICRQKFDSGDRLTVAAIIFSLARIAFTHVIIIWHTNNINDEYRDTHHFTNKEIYQREMGAKFTLVARSLYILLLWTQKCVLLVFYRRLVYDMPWGKPTLVAYLTTFVITFCLGIIFTFVECHPFSRYYTVLPDPGSCVRATDQLFVVGILNIFTDLMLIALPVPVLLQVHLSLAKKLQLGFLFCIGLVIIVVTAVRIPWTLNSPNSETTRITWTTGEFLAATFVANAPTLYSFRKRFERRKSRQFNNIRSPPRVGPVPLSDFRNTVKTRTQGEDREDVGDSNDTGETLVNSGIDVALGRRDEELGDL